MICRLKLPFQMHAWKAGRLPLISYRFVLLQLDGMFRKAILKVRLHIESSTSRSEGSNLDRNAGMPVYVRERRYFAPPFYRESRLFLLPSKQQQKSSCLLFQSQLEESPFFGQASIPYSGVSLLLASDLEANVPF